jgi:hypothetical protein
MLIIDGMAYEASMIHGCRVVPIDTAMEGIVAYQDMQIPVLDISSSIAWGKKQDGKGYDFFGAIGLPFLASQDWADDKKWWCSEMNFMQIGAAGNWMLDKNEFKRITPNDLYICNYQKSDVITV